MPEKGQRTPLLDRLMAKVSPEPNSGCWLWDGSGNSAGYGTIWVDDKNQYAHRVAYTLFHGPLEDGEQVLHRCDVSSCVNPLHLFKGTPQDNMQDKLQKGRHPDNYRKAREKAKALGRKFRGKEV